MGNRGGIDAVAGKPVGPIIEDMSKVSTAFVAEHLGAYHAVGRIALFFDSFWCGGSNFSDAGNPSDTGLDRQLWGGDECVRTPQRKPPAVPLVRSQQGLANRWRTGLPSMASGPPHQYAGSRSGVIVPTMATSP